MPRETNAGPSAALQDESALEKLDVNLRSGVECRVSAGESLKSGSSVSVRYNPDERCAAVACIVWEPSMMFDIQEIMGFLPHRYPFLLIDRIVEFEPTKRLVAIKNVTINEPFFQGHFPGYPIMPGVLVVEAMAQAGGIIIMHEIARSGTAVGGVHGHRTRQVPPSGDARAINCGSRWMCWRSEPARGALRARPSWTASWPARPR